MRFVKGSSALSLFALRVCVLLLSAAPVDAQGRLTASAQVPSPDMSMTGGSVPGQIEPGTLKLTLKAAIDRALQHNLAVVLGQQGVAAARAGRLQALSDVLPEIGGSLVERRQTTNLETFGITLPGLPPLIGPFNVFDARVSLSQALFDIGAIQRAVAGNRNLDAAQHSVRDARDLVVVAAADLYFQVMTAHSRVASSQAHVETADALSRQARDLKESGLVAGIDVLRAQVQADAERQQLIIARNDEQRQRLSFARAIGLAPGQAFELVDDISYRPIDPVALEGAVKQAYETREDLKSAQFRLQALEAEHKASVGDRLPSLHFAADYGTTGLTAASALPTYTIAGVLRVPIFNLAAQRARAAETEAAVQRQASVIADLRAEIAYEVELALADLSAAGERVKVSQQASDLAGQQLQQARDRFAAGVGDNIAIVQAQQAVASATDNYIASLFAHNAAKAALARALGNAEESAGRLFGFSR
jgi:outer membrane protein TolC